MVVKVKVEEWEAWHFLALFKQMAVEDTMDRRPAWNKLTRLLADGLNSSYLACSPMFGGRDAGEQ
jgi:hypothetical protein